jgi:O-succinylbenzoate synthase
VAERADVGAAAGYGCFKLKVGLADDRERARAVRERIGAQARLRLDANGAWSVGEAERAIAGLADLDIELVEQPCPSLAELAALRARVDVPLAADESIASAADVRAAAETGACDLVCVKLATAGGLEPARAALREAARHGLGAYLASTLDGPWTIAASLQLAAAERVTAACGLATLDLFEEPWADALPTVEAGRAPVPSGPGLGVELAAGALADVGVEELEH